jgi:hypothetical protein
MKTSTELLTDPAMPLKKQPPRMFPMNWRSWRTTAFCWVIAGLVVATLPSAHAAAPTVPLRTRSQKLVVFDQLTWEVTATGTAPLSYQWRKDGVPLTDDGRINGTNSRMLIIAEALPGDAGVYNVVVSNAEGSVVSGDFLVTVAERLKIRRSAGSLRMTDEGFHLSAVTFRNWSPLILEGSDDLRHWDPLATSTAVDGLADMVVPTGAQPRKFYRVQLPDAIRLTILEDNFAYAPDTDFYWGFSCLIEGTEQTVLFDTGGQPSIFLANAAQLGVNLAAIDHVVISHDHWDHTAGLPDVLKLNPRATVWLPCSVSAATKIR